MLPTFQLNSFIKCFFCPLEEALKLKINKNF